MTKLLLLPITLPLRIARATAERSFGVARGVLDTVLPTDRPDLGDDVFSPMPPPATRAPRPAPGPAPAPEPRVEPEPEAQIPSLEVLEGDEHIETEDELVAETGTERAPGPEIHVDEPWAGYDAMELDEVLERLGDASEAEVAIVRLYERQNENRQAVLLATGERP
jgi:hypothetical protein